jgi:hypothetical protein
MKIIRSLVLTAIAASTAYSQATRPTPKPTPHDEDVVKISTNLIQIDVSVTDAKTYTLKLKPDAYQRVKANGFVYRFVFPVKKPGAYQYRVAIRDAQSGRVGSASQFIEVPDLKKNRLTVSSIVLENRTADQWRSMSLSGSAGGGSDPVADTALRRVRVGSVLRYGYEIYNAKLKSVKKPQLQTKICVFRDGSLILDGKPTSFELAGQTDLQHLRAVGAAAIGLKLVPGDYILQVIVTDQLAGVKQQIATQFVQFEVVE